MPKNIINIHTNILMKKTFYAFLLAMLLMPFSAMALDNGTYYLYNLGAKRYMNFGGSDGYTAAFLDYGSPLSITAVTGGYNIGNTHYDSGAYLSSSGVGNTTASVFTITETSAGSGIYTIKASNGFFGYDSSKESTLQSGTTVAYNLTDNGSDNVHWQLLTKAELEARLAEATPEHPVDATFYIAAPGMNRHEYGLDTKWTVDKCVKASLYYNPNQAIWHTSPSTGETCSMKQTLTGLKEGKYRLTCQGFYRAGSNTDAYNAYTGGTYAYNGVIFAGDQTCPLLPMYVDGQATSAIYDAGKATNSSWTWTNSTQKGGKYYPYYSNGNTYPSSSACVAFDNNLYLPREGFNTVEFDVYAGQPVDIGAKTLAGITYDWMAVDNFRLEYLGELEQTLEEHYAELIVGATPFNPATLAGFDGSSAEGWTYQEIGAHTHGGFPIETHAQNDGTGIDASKFQVWTGTGYQLGNSKTFTTLHSLPAGYYLVTADVRVYDENGDYNGTAQGLSFYANGESKTITTGEQITGGNLAGKGFVEHVGIVVQITDGNLETGFQLNGSSFNWLSWNNFNVAYLSATDPAEGAESIDVLLNVENNTVKKFLDECGYNDDTASSVVAKYSGVPGRNDQPSTFSFYMTDGTRYEIKNMIPGETRIIDVTDGNGQHYAGKVTADPDGHVRMIDAGNIINVRDLGGWTVADGRKIRYGRIYRGGQMNGQYSTATAANIQTLKDLGIGAEIDLRYQDDYDKDDQVGISAFGFTEGDDFYAARANDYTAANLNETATQQRLKEEFQFILRNIKADKGVYFHCAWGADRTGMLSFLLEGVLGQTMGNLYRNYELTSFSAAGNRLFTSFKDRINVITALSGANLRDKFENYFINKLGVTKAEIDEFRALMLTDNDAKMSIKANVRYGTFIAPYDVTLPTGVKAYTVSTLADGSENVLQLDEVAGDILSANTPVIINAENEINQPVSGHDISIRNTYTYGLLTGVVAPTVAPQGSYVLQQQDGKAGFYRVESSVNIPAGRCFLNAPTNEARTAFFLNESDATAIEAMQALSSDHVEIYDINGRRLPSLQKGINIVEGHKILVK